MEPVLFKETSGAVKVKKPTGERINISKGQGLTRGKNIYNIVFSTE